MAGRNGGGFRGSCFGRDRCSLLPVASGGGSDERNDDEYADAMR